MAPDRPRATTLPQTFRRGPSSVAKGMTKRVSNARKGLRNVVLLRIQSALGRRLISVYTDKFKASSLTADQRMPWPMRAAIHEIADEVWENVQLEIERALEKMMSTENLSESSVAQLSPFDSAPGDRMSLGAGTNSTLPSPPPSPPDESGPTRTSDSPSSEEVFKAPPESSGTLSSVPSESRTGWLQAAATFLRSVKWRCTDATIAFHVLDASDIPKLQPNRSPKGNDGARVQVVLRESFLETAPSQSEPDDGATWNEHLQLNTRLDKVRLEDTIEFRLLIKDEVLCVARLRVGDICMAASGETTMQSMDEQVMEMPLLPQAQHYQIHAVLDGGRQALSSVASLKDRTISLSPTPRVKPHSPSVESERHTEEKKSDRHGALRVGVGIQLRSPSILEMMASMLGLTTVLSTIRRVVVGALQGTVTITVHKATRIKAADISGTSDPYITIRCNGQVHTTKVIPKTLNPRWNETFTFQGTLSALIDSPVEMNVYDRDLSSRDDNIGVTMLELSNLLDVVCCTDGIFSLAVPPKPSRTHSLNQSFGASGADVASTAARGTKFGGPFRRLKKHADRVEEERRLATEIAAVNAQRMWRKRVRRLKWRTMVQHATQPHSALSRGIRRRWNTSSEISASEDFRIPLAPKGHLFVTARVSATLPSHRQLLDGVARRLHPLTPWNAVKVIQKVMHDAASCTVHVRVLSASDLPVADTGPMGRGGTSDPYFKLSHASSQLKHTTYTSNVIPNTLNPHWDESFSFDVLRWRLAAHPIGLQVYDDDLLSKDDLLGQVDLQLNDELIEDISRGAHKEFELGLSSKGAIKLQVRLLVQSPSCSSVSWYLVSPYLWRLRAFLLYHRMPYDRSIYTKLRDPWWVLVMCTAASPDIVVRGIFFTVFLACVATDREEFQIMRFILGLKGTQFISAIIKLFPLSFSFWSCAALPGSLDANWCQLEGPGANGSGITGSVLMIFWLQALTWAAFLMLPYATKFDPRLGVASREHLSGLWERNKQLGLKAGVAVEPQAEDASEGAEKSSSGNDSAQIGLARMSQSASSAASTISRSTLSAFRAITQGTTSTEMEYQRLVDDMEGGLLDGLMITVVSGQDLMAADRNGLSDPYVTIDVGGVTRRSRVMYKTLSPDWNERMVWSVSLPDISSSTLKLAVWDKDRLSTDDLLGKASVQLGFLSSLGASEPVTRQVVLSTRGSIRLQFRLVRATRAAALASSQANGVLPMEVSNALPFDHGADGVGDLPIMLDAVDRLRSTYGETIIYQANYDSSRSGSFTSVSMKRSGAVNGQSKEPRMQKVSKSKEGVEWSHLRREAAGICRALLMPVIRMVQNGATGENRMILLLVWDTLAFSSVSFLFVVMTATALEHERVLVAKQSTEAGSLQPEVWGIVLRSFDVLNGSAFGTWQAKITFQVRSSPPPSPPAPPP